MGSREQRLAGEVVSQILFDIVDIDFEEVEDCRQYVHVGGHVIVQHLSIMHVSHKTM